VVPLGLAGSFSHVLLVYLVLGMRYVRKRVLLEWFKVVKNGELLWGMLLRISAREAFGTTSSTCGSYSPTCKPKEREL
jgi:hypothetical protein